MKNANTSTTARHDSKRDKDSPRAQISAMRKAKASTRRALGYSAAVN